MRNDDAASKALGFGAARDGGKRGNIGIGRGGRTRRYDVAAAAEARGKFLSALCVGQTHLRRGWTGHRDGAEDKDPERALCLHVAGDLSGSPCERASIARVGGLLRPVENDGG